MDSVLVVGEHDRKVPILLAHLGYDVHTYRQEKPLSEVVAGSVIDLIIIDACMNHEVASELCSFIRQQEATKTVPMIVVSDKAETIEEINECDFQKIEVMRGPVSIGALAAKVATHLRLRKMAGSDESKSSLSEINARLRDLMERFKKDLDDARAIQLDLLPSSLPADPRYDLSVSYQPLEEVGGDWYFASRSEDGSISLQIADVTGHGLSAAFIGSMTKLAFTAAGTGEPGELLKKMNKLMSPQLPEGRFVTIASLQYQPATGELKFARGGHPPLLVLNRATGTVREMKGVGYALGFFEDTDYSTETTTLEVGDIALLYTDGISEVQNRAMETYGLTRLAAAMRSTSPESGTAQVLEHVIDDFDKFRDERILKDDVTLIALKRIK